MNLYINSDMHVKLKKKKIISISKYFFMFLGEKMLMSLFLALGRSILG